MTLGQIVIAQNHWTKNLCVFDANTLFFFFKHIYWLNIRPRANRVYPKRQLILHMHIGLGLELFWAYWLKVGIYLLMNA